MGQCVLAAYSVPHTIRAGLHACAAYLTALTGITGFTLDIAVVWTDFVSRCVTDWCHAHNVMLTQQP